MATLDTPLMQYPCSNVAKSNSITTMSAPLHTMTEVVAAISILPNFSSNHKLRDEMDSRQRGIITISNGYQPPKSEILMTSTEVTADKKAAAKKMGRGTKADTGPANSGRGGKRPVFNVSYESKSDVNDPAASG